MFWTILLAILPAFWLLERLFRSLKVGNFGDKYVFITGCDTGFGNVLACRLDKLGFNVFAGCLTADGAKQLTQSCSERLTTIVLDVSNADSRKKAVQMVQSKLPEGKGLWALVNNAGVGGPWAPVDLCCEEDFTSIFGVNFFGLTELTRLCLPMIRQEPGRIVNMASAAGRMAFVASPYTCSKYAVEAYSDILRIEHYKTGVKVSVMEPGVFRTAIIGVEGMVDKVKKAYDKSSPEVQEYFGPGLLDRCRERFIGFNENGSSDVNQVVNAYTHAVTAKYPKKRYSVGNDCRYTFLPLSYLPSFISDFIIDALVFKGKV